MTTIDDMLADEFSRSLRYLIVTMGSNSDIPYEGLATFSCAEAEAFAEVLKLGALPLDEAEAGAKAAAMVIAAHAAGDQPGDDHYVDQDTVVTTWTPGNQVPRRWFRAAGRPNVHGIFHAYQQSGPDGIPFGRAIELHIASVETFEQD